jgi:hypothetical protein
MSKRPLITGVAATLVFFGVLASLGGSNEHAEICEVTRCHQNMLIIAVAEKQYYELHGRYTVRYSELEEVSPGVSEFHCPEDPDLAQYVLGLIAGGLYGDPPPGYLVECGCERLFHGSILDGVPGWE